MKPDLLYVKLALPKARRKNSKDPLNWAKSQMTFAPKLIWPGKIYSEKEMLDIRVDFTSQEDRIQKTEKILQLLK